MGKLHRDNAGYVGCSYEDTQDPFWSYNKLALALSQGETVAGSTGGLPIFNTSDAFGATKGAGTRNDSNASSLVLAVAMDGANGATSFTDQSATIKGSGSAQTLTSNGGANTSTTTSKYYGSSGYFDGSNDYLSLGSTASNWKFLHDNTAAYTVECWIYYIGFTGINGTFISTDWGSSASEGFTLAVQPGNNLSCRMGNGGNGGDFMQVLDSASTNISTNTWTHVAVTYDLTTFRLFVNGVLAGSTTAKNTPSNSAPLHAPYIGGNPDGTYGSKYTNCYLQDVRIYNGVAKYTSNFVVPESGPSTVDLSASRKAVTNVGTTWQTSVAKNYGGAAQFSSGNRLLLADSSDWNLGSTFTVEFWVYRTGSTRGHIIGQYDYPNNGSGSWSIEIDGPGVAVGSNKLFFGILDIGGADKNYNCTYANYNQWDHIAVTREGNGIPMIFINGSPQVVTSAGGSGSGIVGEYSLPLAIGGEQDGAYGLTGYLQDIRIYKGIAKYTSSFIPPTRSLVTQARRYPSGVYVVS
jgi:hypothetical protein